MDERRLVKISKYLSKHLRHQPERIGLTLDPAGWAKVEDLLRATADHRFPITRDELDQVVAANDKQRFAFDDTGEHVRASQGHSIPIDLGLPVTQPPPVLYHGTVARSLPDIRRDGLRPMRRHAVHLSPDKETATRVGSRRGRPVILCVQTARMTAAGHEFRVSANGVWLVDAVPPEFITIL
ncbi:RNA 2'-phosphotransferase [Actinomadura vinacea]|uniref:Probable RNA 2'-phosphotransferase n=1 Tax=Actinomadura vinacea TaxID=115336 RepID=A0ABN3KIW9_9ACTN